MDGDSYMDEKEKINSIVAYLQSELDDMLLYADCSADIEKYAYTCKAQEAQDILYAVSEIIGI